MLIFYDSRDVANSQANVYMATSNDGGNTFENFIVSDQAHTPSPISGLAGGYAGDYIGVASLNDVAYPFWADNRTGNYQGWIVWLLLGPLAQLIHLQIQTLIMVLRMSQHLSHN